MHIVYEAENIIDAHLVRGLLEQAGVPAFVLGEYLGGGIGELPASGLVRVGVAENHIEAAEEALRAWRASTPMDLSDAGDAADDLPALPAH